MHPEPSSNHAPTRRVASALAALLATISLSVVLAVPGSIARAADGEEGPPNPAKCVKVRTSARYVAYGYDHVVELENTCNKAMSCAVSTDANPTPASVDLAIGETKSVLTYRGSPASEFTAQVDCKQQ
jgi:hypothetical protein